MKQPCWTLLIHAIRTFPEPIKMTSAGLDSCPTAVCKRDQKGICVYYFSLDLGFLLNSNVPSLKHLSIVLLEGCTHAGQWKHLFKYNVTNNTIVKNLPFPFVSQPVFLLCMYNTVNLKLSVPEHHMFNEDIGPSTLKSVESRTETFRKRTFEPKDFFPHFILTVRDGWVIISGSIKSFNYARLTASARLLWNTNLLF